MVVYSLGTFACAFSPNIGTLVFFRLIASLGIGGEWAAGASMVAEVVPERSRVEAGALLYTSAPPGLFLATAINALIAGWLFADSPEISWRLVILSALLPAAFAFVVRWFLREPERWRQAAAGAPPPRLRELFRPPLRRATLSGYRMALVALLTGWAARPPRRPMPCTEPSRCSSSSGSSPPSACWPCPG
jgi:MFS family permease